MHNIYYEEINTALNAFEIYKLFYSQEYSFFLDSGLDTQRLGRYSFIGASPFLRVQVKNDKITLWEGTSEQHHEGNPFLLIKELMKQYKVINDTDFPFIGGAVGFFAYDLYQHMEKITRTVEDDLDLPDLCIGFYDGVILIDHRMNKVFAISAGLPHHTLESAKKCVLQLKEKVESSPKLNLDFLDTPYQKNQTRLESNLTLEHYLNAVNRAKEYIRCGDIYQMNMTQRFSTLIDKHPLHLYEKLRTINPAPFAGYMDFGSFQILSSSPERFLQIRKRMIETRPIKGTMPRGKTPEEDKENYEALKSSEKDKAENMMIVDLMRNDLGRVSKIGTVHVPSLFNIETYPTVFHLVSTVVGELKEDYDAIDCITATFPGGSITGAPKIRAMEIIDELEPTARHVYTGSIGYLGFDGDMDLNIVIRTILIKGEKAYYQVGGGIVWDSIPEMEFQESLDKGAALKKTLLGKSEQPAL